MPTSKAGKAEEKAPLPREFISESMRLEIEQNGSARDMHTGEDLTRADLAAYQNATRAKQ